MRTLTPTENRILDHAEQHPIPLRPGDRSRIRDTFGWNPALYVQRLNRLLDDPAAEQARPLLVHRLRRLRADALKRRSLAS